MKKIILGISVMSFMLYSCGNNNSLKSNEKTPAESTEEKIPETLVKLNADLINAPFDQYILLKEALYNNDFTKSISVAKEMNSLIVAGLKENLTGETKAKWSSLQIILCASLTKIENSKNIEEARIQFSVLSENMINAVKTYGIKQDKIFIQHCPMAKNASGGEGADWLDKDSAISNPYFGSTDEMKECGETKEGLKFQQ